MAAAASGFSSATAATSTSSSDFSACRCVAAIRPHPISEILVLPIVLPHLLNYVFDGRCPVVHVRLGETLVPGQDQHMCQPIYGSGEGLRVVVDLGLAFPAFAVVGPVTVAECAMI